MSTWTLGIDFGQRNDQTAIAGLEITAVENAKSLLALRYLHRLPVGMTYPHQCAFIGALVESTPEFERARIAVDATGVGVAVVDQLREHLPRGFTELTITAGATRSRDGNRLSVPKRDLVSRLAVVMQARRLKVAAALEEAADLFGELASFGVTISDSGHDSYGATTGHDDLVLAVSYAVWLAEDTGHGAVWMEYLRDRAGGSDGKRQRLGGGDRLPLVAPAGGFAQERP